MDFAALNNSWYIVSFAYLAAFLSWTAFSAKNFTSTEWRSVCSTRVTGYINLLCSILPAMYILVYCATQFAAEDWKEASAAVVALLFTLLNAARTAWGLWQLYAFRSWCAQSIDALRLMGVSVRFTNKRLPVTQDSSSSWLLADKFLVNNSIVNSQLLIRDVKSYLCYDDHEQLRMPTSSFHGTWQETPKLLWRYVAFLVNSFSCFFVMMLDGVRFVLGFVPSGKFRQVPKKPAEVWVNWAVAFAAQGLQAWMADFQAWSKRRADGEGMESRNTLTDWQRRYSFYASEVLSRRILHLLPEVEGDRGRTGPMVWSGWERETMVHLGRVARDELLEMAVSSGEGLPFGAPHDELLRQYEGRWSGEKGYRAYGRHLANKVVTLDVRKEFCPEIENLDVNMLECLTILLYLGTRSMNRENISREGSSGH